MNYETLKKDLLYANVRALEVSDLAKDNGTCNFDTCVLFQKGLNYKKLKDTVMGAGLYVSKWSAGEYHIYGYEKGQANNRTRMVETFTETLKNLGYNVSVYYAID